MDNNIIIHSDNFTDANGDIHYFNTGRDNVSGLSFPSHYIQNKDNYIYTRILNIKLSTDTLLVYPIHECFLLTTYPNDNTIGITNIVNVDAIVKKGTVDPKDIKITCTPLTYNLFDEAISTHNIKAALKTETKDGNTINCIGIWLNTEDIVDIIIRDLSSLAYNEIPNNIYKEFLQCDYNAIYLDNENVMYEVDMFILEESIGTKIADSIGVNDELIDKVNNINVDIESATPDYKFLSVIYDDLYSIKNINVDENIKPTAFQYVQVDNSFANINGDAIQVKDAGNYLIALKVNMDINEGNETDMMMSLFVNSDRIEETTTRLHLNPANKVHPLGFLSGQVRIQLKPSDKLYLKARWTNKENVNIENHCTLQITKLNNVK